MKKIILTLILAFWVANFEAQLYAQTATEIIDKAEELIRGNTSQGKFTMNVVTPDFKRTVKMETWNKGNDKALIVISSPRREAGNKTLKIGNELWTYLKSTETTMKLPPSMLLQSWNGSDLTNDDLVRATNLTNDYNLKKLNDERIGGENCWKIELTPKSGLPAAWGKIIYWVRKTDYLPAQVQYFDERNRLHRTIEFSNHKTMGGRKIPTVWKVVSNTKPGNYTEFIYDDVKFNVNIPDRIFSMRELER